MAAVRPYPHYEINVKDNSIATISYEEILPVHRPLWPMKAQEGPVAFPTWCPSYLAAKNTFGAETFKASNKKYFSKQSAFLLDTLTYNGAFICRIADNAARKSMCILEAYVTEVDIPQYEVDETGARTLDELGNYIPKTDAEGNAISEKGIRVVYKTRNLFKGSELDPNTGNPVIGLGELTSRNEGGAEVFPILAFEALYPGEYGNDLAFDLSYKTKENNLGDMKYFESVFYSFAPCRRQYGSTTVDGLRDKYARLYTTFAANPEAMDKDTGLIQSMENMCVRGYEADGYTLPYTIYTYEDSFKAIGNRIIKATVANVGKDLVKYLGFDPSLYDKEGFIVPTVDEDGVITGYTVDDSLINSAKIGYMINVLSSRLINKQLASHFIVESNEENAVICADDAHIFLGGGEDGDLSDATVMDGVKALCAKKLQPMIVDKPRFPFTHMYDPGYDMSTKYAMLEFLDVRDDIGVSLSTQVLFDNGEGRSITINDQADDEANGEALRAYALLMRESILMGTDCCRASIYCHTGMLAGGNYIEPMPFTYWDAHQHAMYGRTQYMSVTEPRGLPLAYNDLFRINTINWTNYDPDGQSRVWNTGLNYVQYADMSRIHFPALRTVYRAETSVLVDQWFVDAVIYSKHIIRKAWAKFSGRNDTTTVLQGAIKKYLDDELNLLYAGKYQFEVTVYQTEDEVLQGYVQHVKLKLIAPAQFRVLVVDIEVNREGYTPEA